MELGERKRKERGWVFDEIDSYDSSWFAAISVEWIIHLAALLLVQLFMVKKCIDRESLPEMIYAPLQIAACPL